MPARDPDAVDGDDHTVAAEPDGTAPVDPGEPMITAPRWLELGAVGGAVVLASVGSVGLLLAINERYRTDLAILLAAPIVAVAMVAVARAIPVRSSTRTAHAGAAAAVVIALGFGAFAGVAPAQNVVVSRDPGSYLTTARWLVREGKLSDDARGQAFAGIDGLTFAGAAQYDMGGTRRKAVDGTPANGAGKIEFQFNHLASVALASGYDVGGHRLMFRLPALMSAGTLVLVYAVAVRVGKRPLLALLAPVLLAAALPMLYVARNTYSESFASVLLWAAVLLAIGLHRRPRAATGAVTGLLLGALVSTRVDALLYVGLLMPLAAISIAAAPGRRVQRARAVAWVTTFVVAGAVGLIGWIDLNEQSGHYVVHLSEQLDTLRTGVIGLAVSSVVGLAAWLLVPQLRRLAPRLRTPVGWAAGVVVLAALAFGWLIRPEIQEVQDHKLLSTVENVQRAQGLPIEPARNYAELTLPWMAWYLGPIALALAIGAMAYISWRSLARRADAAQVGLLALCLGAGALYWYDPQITPDQLWATRRFVPAVFPALAIWAAAGVALVAGLPPVRRLTGSLPSWGTVGLGVAAAAVVAAPAVATTMPVRWSRIQPGYLKPVLDACDALPDDAAVVTVGGFGGATLGQSIRAWCGNPVASAGEPLEPERVEALAREVGSNGYRLHLVSPDISGLTDLTRPGGPDIVSTSSADQRWDAEQTLEGPPDEYDPPEEALPVPTPFTLHVLDVTPVSAAPR